MSAAPADFTTAFTRCPLVAILRGIAPGEVEAVGGVTAAFEVIEHIEPWRIDALERVA